MAGKYAKVLKKLPRLRTTESPQYQEKVEALKTLLTAPSQEEERQKLGVERIPLQASVLANEYNDLRLAKEVLQAQLSEIELQIAAITQLLDDQFEAEGLTLVRLDDGARVMTRPEPYAVVKDPTKFRQWCIDQGLQEKMTLPWQTTNALTKERLLAGEPEPDGIEAFQLTKAVWYRGEEDEHS